MKLKPRAVIWRILLLVGLPVMGVSAYLLHEAIYPGRGILEYYYREPVDDVLNPLAPGDFSHVNSFDYWFFYYIPFGIGALFTAVGWYLKATEPMERHVMYDEMET